MVRFFIEIGYFRTLVEGSKTLRWLKVEGLRLKAGGGESFVSLCAKYEILSGWWRMGCGLFWLDWFIGGGKRMKQRSGRQVAGYCGQMVLCVGMLGKRGQATSTGSGQARRLS